MLPPESAIPYQWHIPRENVLDTIVAVNSPWLLDVLKKKNLSAWQPNMVHEMQ